MDRKKQMPFRLNDLPDYSDIQENEILYNTTYAPGPNSNFINRVYSSVSEMLASINRSASNLFSSRQPLSRCRAQHRGNIFRLPPGLRNLGNTCYMNSLLQCMCASSSFTSFLQSQVGSISSLCSRNLSEDELRSNDIVSQLAQLFSDLEPSGTQKEGMLQISQIYSTLCGDFTLYNQQQDPHQLFLYLHQKLLSWLKTIRYRQYLFYDIDSYKDFVSLTKGGPSHSMTSSTASQSSHVESQGSFPKIFNKLDFSGLVDFETDNKTETEKLEAASPFLGIYLNKIRCKKCLESVNRFENGCCLTLPIVNRPGMRFAYLEDCLKQYFAKETVGDYSCKRCGMLEVIHDLSQQIEAIQNQPHISRFACQLGGCLQFEGRQQVDSDVIIRSLRKQKQFLLNAYKRGIEPQEFEQSFNIYKSKSMSQKERGYLLDIPEVRCPITKSISLVKPPQILVIHLQRLTYSNSGYLVKNNQHVQYEETLNLAPYVSLDYGQFQNFYPSQKTQYSLIGAIEHIGPAHFGHYVSFRKASPQKSEEEAKRKEENETSEDLHSMKDIKDVLHQLEGLGYKGDAQLGDRREERKEKNQNNSGEWIQNLVSIKEENEQEGETASEKPRKKRRAQQELWVKCDDSKVEGIEKWELLQRPAYMLFYQRERI